MQDSDRHEGAVSHKKSLALSLGTLVALPVLHQAFFGPSSQDVVTAGIGLVVYSILFVINYDAWDRTGVFGDG